MTSLAHERPINRLLPQLHGVKAAGRDKWMAKCPAHDDREQSLSITIGKDDRVLMTCHASCSFNAIVSAAGLAASDLFPGSVPTRAAETAKAPGVEQRLKLVKSYDYTDANGTMLFQACRFEPKTFRQRRPVGNDWKYNIDGIEPVLYRLPEIIEAVASGRRVYIVEGEKDADALVEHRLDATTSPMGAGKWRDSYSDTLSNADVVILPDNDEPGRNHAGQVAASLFAKGARVRIVALPDLPIKGDVSDWLNAGGDFDDLDELIEKTPIWHPDPSKKSRWLLSELWQNESIMRPPPPVVPYLAWGARCTLLAAREKSGKSTLTGYMAACVSNGSDFLGEPCERGKVLLVGLEEFVGDTARRLRQFGANGDMIEIVTFFVGDPKHRPEELRAHVKAVGPALVIVDSLIAYAEGVVTDASNATQTQVIVNGITSIAHDTGAALVLIHHARKSDGKYRDSSAIGGAVDVIAEVFPPDEAADPTRRRVRPIGRVPAKEIDFRFTGHSYEICDPSGPVKPPLDQRIEMVVKERPGISSNDIVTAVGETRDRVLERIKLMIVNGHLVDDGERGYRKLRLPTFKQGNSLW